MTRLFRHSMGTISKLVFLGAFALSVVACDDSGGSSSALCGNSQVDEGEECDDANGSSWDGCNPDCTLGEDCDNLSDDDGDGLIDLDDPDCAGYPGE